ncbi:helix-turn-helix domain-containing protein [Pelagicoccus albus]|uniref:Helix-turn-helix domain-containing protein n=1 Tax=Pelagicoccus albus TaxID=415222 RepID=A0A7X1B811_9BACT|nr:helix-turn-helix domain-containing protein [Pelagicoccus albus]MBC2607276.1 helix-turn-helix domain-containing protein [Pelagicoccus albus]
MPQPEPVYDRLTIQEFFVDPNFPLTAYHEVRNVPMRMHTHEFGELVFVKGGRGQHVLPGETYELEAGDVFFLPKNIPHGYEAPESLELFNVLFLASKLPWNLQDLDGLPGFRLLFQLEPRARKQHRFASHLRLVTSDFERVQRIITRLNSEVENRPAGYETMSIGLFLELVAYLARAYENLPSEESVSLRAVDKAMRYLSDNYSDELDVALLAKRCGMSERSFYRAFRDAAGTSPKQFVLELRLRHAKDALLVPGSRVTDVALDAGFSDSNYFTRIFKEHVGQSPSAWAKSMSGRPSLKD